MKEAEIIWYAPYGKARIYLCSYKSPRGFMYGLCPSKTLYEVGARAPIGFFKSGDDYKMYIKKGEANS